MTVTFSTVLRATLLPRSSQEATVPLTAEERLRGRRLNRHIRMYLDGSLGSLSIALAAGVGTWLALLTGLPFFRLAYVAWRAKPDIQPG
jgi:hypothetical protein